MYILYTCISIHIHIHSCNRALTELQQTCNSVCVWESVCSQCTRQCPDSHCMRIHQYMYIRQPIWHNSLHHKSHWERASGGERERGRDSVLPGFALHENTCLYEQVLQKLAYIYRAVAALLHLCCSCCMLIVSHQPETACNTSFTD